MRIRTALLAAAVVSGPMFIGAGWGATADETLRVSPTQPAVAWNGERVAAAAVPDAFALCRTPQPAACIEHRLDVAVDSSYWRSSTGGVRISIQWDSAEDDFDLSVVDASGKQLGFSSSGTTTETVLVNQPSGVYGIRVVPVLVTDSGYRGTARLDVQKDRPAGGSSVSYVSSPHSARQESTRAVPRRGEPLRVRTQRTGQLSGEPTVGVDPAGRAFLTGISPLVLSPETQTGANQSRVVRSTDGGRSFSDVTAPRLTGSSPITNDPYVHVDEVTGRIFAVDLLGPGAYLSISADGGRSWRAGAQLGDPAVNDHQTLTTGPPAPGLVPTDPTFPRVVYYCSQKLLAATCAVSLDGGGTFRLSGAAPFELTQGAAEGSVCETLHGHAVVDRKGRLLLPAATCGQPDLAVSADGGLTWTRTVVADVVAANGQTSIAVDDAGTWYFVFQDRAKRLPYLVTSRNQGASWTRPVLVAPPGLRESGWATAVAGAAGRVAVLFPGTEGDPSDAGRPWDGWVAVSTNGGAAQPTWAATTWNDPADPVHRGECPLRCGNHYEFWDLSVRPGRSGALWGAAVDSCTGLLSCASRKADGYSINDTGTSFANGVATDAQGVAFVQLSGPRLRP